MIIDLNDMSLMLEFFLANPEWSPVFDEEGKMTGIQSPWTLIV